MMGTAQGSIQWPEGKKFAFTIFDDTDEATPEKIQPVYSFLSDCGFRTTKTVWPVRGAGTPVHGGSTCEDPLYLDWLLDLRAAGFEIAFHMATFHSSVREDTIAALDRFSSIFGGLPSCMANHSGCLENMYWGSYRLTGLHRWIYDFLTHFKNRQISFGHVESDRHFWGDICRTSIKYVRNFVFPDINTLKACPLMPYHDPQRPFVKYWFASSEGARVQPFVRCLSEAAQDRLEREGGACIMYAHLACGFFEHGRLEPRFEKLMQRLSKKNGWFVPTSTILDYLLATRGTHVISHAERNKLERDWLVWKMRNGSS